MKIFIMGILTILALSIFGTITVKEINLEQNCTGYLKRAADANTVETASNQLGKAIDYLEKNNITTGYTSILWKTPDEDIEFWYNNIKASQDELSKVDSSTMLEKTNTLIKLRETLIDNEDRLIVPGGLSRYPNNFLFGFLMWVGVFLITALIIWGTIELMAFLNCDNL